MGKNRRKKERSRKYMQRFSATVVSTGRGPDPGAGYLDDQGKLVPMTLGSRSQAAISGVPNAYLDRIFPGVNSYTPEKITVAMLKGPNANPRQLVLGKLWQGDRRQGVTRFVELKLLEGKRTKLSLMLAQGGEDCFFIETKVKYAGIIIRKSIEYANKQRALAAHGYNQICWVNTKTIPSFVADTPIPPG